MAVTQAMMAVTQRLHAAAAAAGGNHNDVMYLSGIPSLFTLRYMERVLATWR